MQQLSALNSDINTLETTGRNGFNK